MGIDSLLIIIIVIAVLAIALPGQIAQVVASAQQFTQSQTAQASAGINPKVGQQVCDLKLTFTPQLVVTGNPSISGLVNILAGSPGWQLNGASNIQWLNCGTYGVLGKMNWVPWFVDKQPSFHTPKLDFVFSAGGQVVHWNLILTAPDGTYKGYQTDPFCVTYCTTVNIPAGVTAVPKAYTITFVIQSIPRQNYGIAITSDIPINNVSAGQPYIQKVNP